MELKTGQQQKPWTVDDLEREMDYPANVERIVSMLNTYEKLLEACQIAYKHFKHMTDRFGPGIEGELAVKMLTAIVASEETREEGADRRGIDGNTKAYLCTVCHKACVDAEAGYDTCEKCLKNI